MTTLFAQACQGIRGPRAPVWIMRQAGRYLPEYRKIREQIDFVTATKTPEIAARITLQPMERFPLDAAILFSDIMTPLEGMGATVDFTPGPVVARPIRSRAEARALRPLDPAEGTPFVLETLGIVRSALRREASLIAFAGAPFTLFCYLVEGKGSKEFMTARRFLRAEPEASAELLDLLGRSMAGYLIAQARAGADALMLFDSWVGLLGPDDYRRHVLPVVQETVRQIRSEVSRPIIYFANAGATLLSAARGVGADVMGIHWTVPLSRATGELGPHAVLQGNLDPAALFARRDELDASIRTVLAEGAGAAAHVFNLGHGIDSGTDPDQVSFLVDRVQEHSAAGEPRAPAQPASQRA